MGPTTVEVDDHRQTAGIRLVGGHGTCEGCDVGMVTRVLVEEESTLDQDSDQGTEESRWEKVAKRILVGNRKVAVVRGVAACADGVLACMGCVA